MFQIIEHNIYSGDFAANRRNMFFPTKFTINNSAKKLCVATCWDSSIIQSKDYIFSIWNFTIKNKKLGFIHIEGELVRI